MSSIKQDIEIQAVNLAQQWYALEPEDLPQFGQLLEKYLKYFPDETDQDTFLKETLRITEEIVAGPKAQPRHHNSIDEFRTAISQRIKP